MDVLIYIFPIALAMAAVFLAIFIWAVKSGQFEDLSTPAYRILNEDTKVNETNKNKREEDEPRKQ